MVGGDGAYGIKFFFFLNQDSLCMLVHQCMIAFLVTSVDIQNWLFEKLKNQK
jgi:hypothetical protein